MKIWPSQIEPSHRLFNLGASSMPNHIASTDPIAKNAQIPSMDESIWDLHTRKHVDINFKDILEKSHTL